VAIVLREQGLPDHIGNKWIERFRQRHSDIIKKKKNTLIVYKKILKNRVDEIDHWFRPLDRLIKVLKVKPKDIYNMDETGLQEGEQSNRSSEAPLFGFTRSHRI